MSRCYFITGWRELVGRRTVLGACVILGLTIVIGFCLRVESLDETRVIKPLRADARDYFMYAYNLRHRDTYSRQVASLSDSEYRLSPDAVRSPGYPLFLTIFVDGPPSSRMIGNIMLTQVLLSTLMLVVAFFLFRRFLSNYFAVAAVFFTALSPHLIVANSYILTETLFCFLLVILLWLLSCLAKKPSAWKAIMIGLVMGLASLVRPSLQYFPIIAAILLVFTYGRRKGLQLAIIVLVCFAVVLSPWIIRNLITLGVVSDKTLKINFIHHGMYPDFKYDNLQHTYGFPYRYDPRSKEITRNTASVLKEIANRFRREPAKHLNWYIIRKPYFFWSWEIIQGQGDVFIYPVSRTPYVSKSYFRWTHQFMYYIQWVMVLLGGLGCLLVWTPAVQRQYPETSVCILRFVSALLLYFTALHMIGAPFPRYSVPLRPFLYSMAVFTFSLILKNININMRTNRIS